MSHSIHYFVVPAATAKEAFNAVESHLNEAHLTENNWWSFVGACNSKGKGFKPPKENASDRWPASDVSIPELKAFIKRQLVENTYYKEKFLLLAEAVKAGLVDKLKESSLFYPAKKYPEELQAIWEFKQYYAKEKDPFKWMFREYQYTEPGLTNLCDGYGCEADRFLVAIDIHD